MKELASLKFEKKRQVHNSVDNESMLASITPFTDVHKYPP